MRNHIRYPDKDARHCANCGYGAFCKRSPDALYCKTALSGVIYGTMINARRIHVTDMARISR